MFADGIESANIVGYQTQTTKPTGFKLMGASFAAVSASDASSSLADLKVSGYAPYDEEEDEGGTSGAFKIQFLSASGTTEATYGWYDDDTLTAGWYVGGKAVDAASVKLSAAKAVWVKGNALSMTSAGAVNDKDIVVNTSPTGFIALGNTTPVDLTLADLVVTGYDPYDEEEDEGGTSGAFKIQFLTESGTTEATYGWYDDDTLSAGWYAGGKAVDAASIKIPAGTGVWAKGSGLTITIPAPIAKK